MTILLRWRELARVVIVLGAGVASGCAPPPQRKPIEMTPIGTVPAVERTFVEPDGGTTTAPNSAGSVLKDDPCTMTEVESLELALRGCDAPNPRPADLPSGLSDRLELNVTSSAPSTTPGGRVDVTLTLKNKSSEPLPLYFTGNPKPRFEAETFDAKGARRADLPEGKAPRTAYPTPRPSKASRITLNPGGIAHVRVPWDAVKTRWAPEKVKSWEGRGPARTVLTNLRYGKYLVRVAIPLMTQEKTELDVPKTAIDVVAP